MSHILSQTLQHLHDVLHHDASLKEKVTAIYGVVPSQAAIPYLQLKLHEIVDYSSQTIQVIKAILDIKLITRHSLPQTLALLENIEKAIGKGCPFMIFEKAFFDQRDQQTMIWTRRYRCYLEEK